MVETLECVNGCLTYVCTRDLSYTLPIRCWFVGFTVLDLIMQGVGVVVCFNWLGNLTAKHSDLREVSDLGFTKVHVQLRVVVGRIRGVLIKV